MSQEKEVFLFVFGYFTSIIMLGFYYIVTVGVLFLIELVFQTGLNIWIIGLAILLAKLLHSNCKMVSKLTIEKIKKEER